MLQHKIQISLRIDCLAYFVTENFTFSDFYCQFEKVLSFTYFGYNLRRMTEVKQEETQKKIYTISKADTQRWQQVIEAEWGTKTAEKFRQLIQKKVYL